MKKLERSQLLKEIKEAFPDLRHAINQEFGLLHLEVGVFYCFTQQLIDEGKKESVIKAFEIADRFNRLGNKKIQNAIDVSYVEGLEFKNTGKNTRNWAWKLLPQSLKDDYIAFHGINKVKQFDKS